MSTKAIFILNICFVSFCLQQGNSQSPYNMSWKEESYHLGVGAATFTTGLIFASQVKGLTDEEIAAHDRNNVNAFDRPATYNSSYRAKTASDVLLVSSGLLPLSLLAAKDTRQDFGKIAILYGETVFITTGITYFAKGVILRSRPYVYNEDFALSEKQRVNARHAYFSGHTSLTAASCFFTAKVFSDYFPESKYKPLVWAGAIIVPAAVGYFRVAAGKHFPTDVITGYVIGATIGILVPHLHKNIKVGNADSNINLTLGVTGASLKWALN
jgi:membrane-associated phospholipid phosphatase